MGKLDSYNLLNDEKCLIIQGQAEKSQHANLATLHFYKCVVSCFVSLIL